MPGRAVVLNKTTDSPQRYLTGTCARKFGGLYGKNSDG